MLNLEWADVSVATLTCSTRQFSLGEPCRRSRCGYRIGPGAESLRAEVATDTATSVGHTTTSRWNVMNG